MRVKSVLAGEGGGARPPPLITFVLTSKVAVYAPAEWADTLTLFHLYQYVYSVVPPHPLVPGVGAHSLARKGVGESQYQPGDIHCGTLYMYVLCVSICPVQCTRLSQIYIQQIHYHPLNTLSPLPPSVR